MVAVPDSASFHDLLEVAKHTGASRVPIYSGTIDTVVGMVHLKDLFRFIPDPGNGEVPDFDMKPLVRSIYAVPDTLKIDDLFEQMRVQRQQIAVVVDEFGQTAGIVTMEDILEEIVGEVTDEFDPNDQPIVETAHGVLVAGLVDIPSFNERFGFHIDENEFDTVGGFIMGTLGRIALSGDSLELGDYHIKVETLIGKRVKTVRVVRRERDVEDDAPTED